MNSFLTKRGFLFTISIIMFASTLVFFAQTYSTINIANETAIISSAKPQNISLLNDDVSFGLGRLFSVVLDANQGANSRLFASGTLSASPEISTALSSYEAHLTQKLFPLVSGTKSLDFSSISDGKAEVFFGNSFEFDYNYVNYSIALFPVIKKSLARIDLNLRAYGDLNSVVWAAGPVSGSSVININYADDSNSFSLSQNIDENSLSTLVLFYPDSNISLSFGGVQSDANSGVRIVDFSGQKVDYSIIAQYADSNVFPVFWNAKLHYSDLVLDSNSMLIIRK